MLTLAMPQSEPIADMNDSASRTSSVKIADDSPWATSLCRRTASSKSVYVSTYSSGAKVSVLTMSLCFGMSTIAGCT